MREPMTNEIGEPPDVDCNHGLADEHVHRIVTMYLHGVVQNAAKPLSTNVPAGKGTLEIERSISARARLGTLTRGKRDVLVLSNSLDQRRIEFGGPVTHMHAGWAR